MHYLKHKGKFKSSLTANQESQYCKNQSISLKAEIIPGKNEDIIVFGILLYL